MKEENRKMLSDIFKKYKVDTSNGWLNDIITNNTHLNILKQILSYQDAGTNFICKNVTIADSIGEETNVVQEELKSMVNLGYIRITKEYNGKLERYSRCIIAEVEYLRELYHNHHLPYNEKHKILNDILSNHDIDEIHNYCLDLVYQMKHT